jgi:hypothetical protein
MADAALAVSHDRVAAAKEENESTRIVFEDQSRTMQIELRTEYPWSPDSEGNPGLISGFVKALTEAWTGVDVIRSDKRKVAGLEGEEVVAYERKLDALDFTWARNREKSGAQYRPRLRLDMRARGTDREVAISIWDAILGSVRILPRR